MAILIITIFLFSSASCCIAQYKSEILLELPATRFAERVIYYKAYTVSYNYMTLNPNWVAYELTADESDGPVNRKGRRFIPDPNVKGRQAG